MAFDTKLAERILVESTGVASAAALDEWIGVATEYAESLPAK